MYVSMETDIDVFLWRQEIDMFPWGQDIDLCFHRQGIVENLLYMCKERLDLYVPRENLVFDYHKMAACAFFNEGARFWSDSSDSRVVKRLTYSSF